MDDLAKTEAPMIAKCGEVLAVLDEGVFATVELHCEEFSFVGYWVARELKAA